MRTPAVTPRRRRALLRLGAAAGTVLAALAAAAPRPAAAQPPAAQMTEGQRVYSSSCASCHQADGFGTDEAYPPLAGSGWVTGDANRLVRVILHGLTGEIEVAGQMYEGVMPPWGGLLKDEEIAAVATYVRNSFGNAAPAVTPATVAKLRAAHAARKTPWTAAELARAGAG